MQLQNSVKALAWDLDGTILDSFGLYCDILTEVFDRNSIKVPDREVLRHDFHGKLEGCIANAGNISGPLLDKVVADFLEVQNPYYENLEGHIFPDALRLMQRAHDKGLQQIVITNRAHVGRGNASPRHIAQRSPLSGFISYVVCGDDNPFHKPDARMLDQAEHELGLQRSELLVIGDQHVDAVLAQNLGVHAVLVNRSADAIPHLETLEDHKSYTTIVTSLDAVA